jgi:hypothetical protein
MSLGFPNSYLKENGTHAIQLELFRRKTAQSEERVLIGEANIPAGFFLKTPDSHIIVEVLRGEGQIAARVVLRIEKFDGKGRALSSGKSSMMGSMPSISATSNGTTSENGTSLIHETVSLPGESEGMFQSIIYQR